MKQAPLTAEPHNAPIVGHSKLDIDDPGTALLSGDLRMSLGRPTLIERRRPGMFRLWDGTRIVLAHLLTYRKNPNAIKLHMATGEVVVGI